MALSAEQVAVSTTAVALNTSGNGFPKLVVKAATGGGAVHLGDSTVTTTTGFELAAGDAVTVELGRGEQLFAIAGASETVHVLRTGA